MIQFSYLQQILFKLRKSKVSRFVIYDFLTMKPIDYFYISEALFMFQYSYVISFLNLYLAIFFQLKHVAKL